MGFLAQIVNTLLPVQLKGSDVAIPVDLQYHDITNPIPVAPAVQKYATSGEVVAVLAKQVKTATYDTVHPVPDGAKGVLVSLMVHSITGTFGDGQGCNLRIRIGVPGQTGSVTVYKMLDTATGSKFTPLKALGNNVFILHPNLSKTIDEVTAGNILYVQGFLPKGSQLGIGAVIAGTDPSAEIEIILQWLP